MPRFSRNPFQKMISLRVTREQDRLLEGLAAALKLSGKAEVLRKALDYWLEHAPEARKAAKQAGSEEEEG
jgi:hypothetical protein